MSNKAPTIKQEVVVVDKATGKLKVIQAEVGKTGTSMQTMNTSTNTLNASMLKYAKVAGVVAGAVIPLTKAITASVKEYAKFEAVLNKTRAVSGATANEMKVLSQQARELGASTALSASEVGELQFELSKLGFTVDEITQLTPAIGDLSLALGHDLADTASIAGKTLRQFGLEANEMKRVVDVIAQGASSSALDITSFAEAMKFAGSTAGQLGFDIEEATSAIGLLSNVGISGTLAGTGLNQTLLKMADSSSKAGKLLRDFKGDTKDLTALFQHLNKQGLTTNEVFDAFGLIAGKSALALIRNADAMGDLNSKMNDANDRAKDMTEIMEQGINGELKKMTSALSEVKITIGEAFGNEVQSAIRFATKYLQNFGDGLKAINAWSSGKGFFGDNWQQDEQKVKQMLFYANEIVKAQETGNRKAEKSYQKMVKSLTGKELKDASVTAWQMQQKLAQWAKERADQEEKTAKEIAEKREKEAKQYSKDYKNAMNITRNYSKVRIDEMDKIKSKFETQIATLKQLRDGANAKQLSQINDRIQRTEQALEDELQAYKDNIKKKEEAEKKFEESQKTSLQTIRDAQISYGKMRWENAKEEAEIIQAIKIQEQEWAKLDQEEAIEAEKEASQKRIELAQMTASTIANIISSISAYQIKEIQRIANEEIEEVNNRDKKLTVAEKRKQQELKKIRHQAEKDMYGYRIAEWIATGTQMASDGAGSIIRANKDYGLPGGVLAGLALATQTGVWMSNMPQPPKMATGGMAVPTSGGSTVTVAENGNAEAMFNMGASGRPMVDALAKEVSRTINMGGVNVTIQESVNPEATALAVVDALNDAQRRGMI